MVWGKKNSNGSVTVAYLLERQVALSWQEAVAIGLEAAEMTERSGRGVVPAYQNIELKSGGALGFMRGRVQAGDPVSSLAMTLNALLPDDRPTQLRLLLSTAGPGSGTYKSIGEFVEALKYFERPGRRAQIAAVHARAVETPIPVAGAADRGASRIKKKKPMSAGRRWAVAAVTVLAVGAGTLAMAEKSEPGLVTGRVASMQTMAAEWWTSALAATSTVRAAAAEDFSTVAEHLDVVRTDLTEDLDLFGTDTEAEADEGAGGADGSASAGDGVTGNARSDVPPAGDTAPVVKPESADFEAAVDEAVAPDEDVAEPSAPAATVVEPTVRVADRPLMASALFDASDVNVTPPTTVRVQFPEYAEGVARDDRVGVVVAIVSATGEVEKVKLLSPHRSFHQAMILSAVKTWRFRPAVMDGDAVRYRYLIPVHSPRCRSLACS